MYRQNQSGKIILSENIFFELIFNKNKPTY